MHSMSSENGEVVGVWGDDQLSDIFCASCLDGLMRYVSKRNCTSCAQCTHSHARRLVIVSLVVQGESRFLTLDSSRPRRSASLSFSNLCSRPLLLEVCEIAPSDLPSRGNKDLRSSLCNRPARPGKCLLVRRRECRRAWSVIDRPEELATRCITGEPWCGIALDLGHCFFCS